jgi:hypothetical protein
MWLRIVLPKVNPEGIEAPTRCIYAGCQGRKFYLRQVVRKPLRDTVYQAVVVHRYQCLRVRTHLSGLAAGDDVCSDRRLAPKGWP